MSTMRVLDNHTRSWGAGWPLWLGWVVASTIPWGMAVIPIRLILASTDNSFLLSLGTWLLAPLLMGAGQWLLLHRYFPDLSARAWLRVSALTWLASTIILAFALVAAIAVGALGVILLGLQFYSFGVPAAITFAASGVIIVGILGVLAGMVAGFAQANALEFDATTEGHWMRAHAVGVVITWAVSAFLLLPLLTVVGLPLALYQLTPDYGATVLITLLFSISGPLASIPTGFVLIRRIQESMSRI